MGINLFWHVKNIRFHYTSNLTEENFAATEIHVKLSKVLYKKLNWIVWIIIDSAFITYNAELTG